MAETGGYEGGVQEFVEEVGGVGVGVAGACGLETGVAAYEEDEEVGGEGVVEVVGVGGGGCGVARLFSLFVGGGGGFSCFGGGGGGGFAFSWREGLGGRFGRGEVVEDGLLEGAGAAG